MTPVMDGQDALLGELMGMGGPGMGPGMLDANSSLDGILQLLAQQGPGPSGAQTPPTPPPMQESYDPEMLALMMQMGGMQAL